MKRTALLLFVLLCTAPAFAQGTFLPQNTWFPNMDVGGDSGGLHYVTLVQASNNTSSFVLGTITVYSSTGAMLPVSYDGGAPASNDAFSLSSGQVKEIQLSLSGPITQGWLQITYSPNVAETTTIVQYLAGTTVLTEVGIEPFSDQNGALTNAIFPVETNATVNTGIAIANPGSPASVVQAELVSGSTVLGTTTISLAQNGYTAKNLTDLFPSVPNISQIQAELLLNSCTTTACTTQGPGFIATALRINQSNGSFTAVPVESSPLTGSQIVPHIAIGGGLQTVLYLTNPSSTGVSGQASIFDDNGNPLAVSANGGAAAASFPFTVLGGGVMKVTLSGGSTTQGGWVVLTLPARTPLIVNALFQTFNGPTVISEASVLSAPAQTEGLIYVNMVPNVTDIGLALANPQNTSNTITLTLFNSAGFVDSTQSITLAPFGHSAQYLDQIFPQLAGATYNGTLSMQSALGFSTVALRQNLTGRADFAALPVSDDIMYIPSVTGISITSTARTSGGQVNFTINVSDFSPNLVTPTSTAVNVEVGVLYPNLNNAFDGAYSIFADGTALLNAQSGTLMGTFQGQNTTISSGTSAVLYVEVLDSLGNPSNVITQPFKF